MFRKKKTTNKNQMVSYSTKTEDGKNIEAVGYWRTNDMEKFFDKYYKKEKKKKLL